MKETADKVMNAQVIWYQIYLLYGMIMSLGF